MTKRVLTGINTTGTLHIGNYVGAIRPAIRDSRNPDVQSFFFLADLHALIKCQDPARIERSRRQIAATWLAAGLDPDKVVFYRQSDIPEIPTLNWLLTCCTAKGQMNRAHAYKAATDAAVEAGDGEPVAFRAGNQRQQQRLLRQRAEETAAQLRRNALRSRAAFGFGSIRGYSLLAAPAFLPQSLYSRRIQDIFPLNSHS